MSLPKPTSIDPRRAHPLSDTFEQNFDGAAHQNHVPSSLLVNENKQKNDLVTFILPLYHGMNRSYDSSDFRSSYQKVFDYLNDDSASEPLSPSSSSSERLNFNDGEPDFEDKDPRRQLERRWLKHNGAPVPRFSFQ